MTDAKIKTKANKLAAENLLLLYAFAWRKKCALRIAGGHSALVSELSVAYMDGIYNWLSRKRKHRSVKLSTFIWKSLGWGCAVLLSRVAFLCQRNVSNPSTVAVLHLHGDQDDRGDTALSSVVDYGEAIDRDLLHEKLNKLLDGLDRRHGMVLRLRMKGLSFADIGLALNISKGRVRQLEIRAMMRLSDSACKSGMAQFAIRERRPRRSGTSDACCYTDPGPLWDDVVRAYEEDR